MNSKGIEPRVGMQFVFPLNGIRRRISGFTPGGGVICNGYYSCCGDYECTCTSLRLWNDGRYEIEWIPPTDEERAMFRKAAATVDCYEFNHWYIQEAPHLGARQIAESLSMDGM